MSDDEDKGGPSLEPPSFFGRKKRKSKQGPAAAVGSPPPRPVEPAARLDADITPEVEPVPPPVVDPTVEATPTTILEADEPTAIQPSTPEPPPPGPPPPPLFADESSAQPVPASAAPASAAPPEVPSTPNPPRGPWLTGWAAAILTGLVVGGLIVGGTSAAMRLCIAVKGTESCGNPGFVLLVVILVVCVLLGALLLRAARVPEPGSTSFLAVGLLSVVALLFLVDQLLEWWMVIVIPVVSVLTYLLSHWVTSTYVDPTSRQDDDANQNAPEVHDVR